MNHLKKLCVVIAFIAITICSVTLLSSNAQTTPPPPRPTSCYNTGTLRCMSSPIYDAGESKWCEFTTVYGPPVECWVKECAKDGTMRRCIAL